MIYINTYLKVVLTFLIIFTREIPHVFSQSNFGNKYGLHVLNDIKLLQKEIEIDSNKEMVNLITLIPTLELDLKYSTSNNFMHEQLYPSIQTTWLRLPAAKALSKVIEELNNQNLSIKIFDAYRPYSVTEKMWEKVHDSRYAADPAKGSGHNRGVAVDLTLIDLNAKREIEMGTGFDNFSDTAHQDFRELPETILQNRLLLKTTMEKYGFKSLDTEWWHFSLASPNDFEIMDIPFDELKKLDTSQKIRSSK